mmetsp:Transcript_48431/g.138421  ORF Transcript_48431/g.138421 Transcript_48431/m.138421 type:complete len:145 (+) Transcript_48431:79-513(+)|eukprot:CAMPEP_0168378696 /NCGR_PEP_ID=MMETSP0228-20121227/11468_1 /TAXON_ID=133427 /ORGANISM="Protoceratium reticulatum, Strain CCCM 535 (=CCMP 1889)" /LENGTH=144 /DNA_ID=CAMNT_0008391719 /DNA_START=93 /DNA_END=527 /DNA_ORIENTATION=+
MWHDELFAEISLRALNGLEGVHRIDVPAHGAGGQQLAREVAACRGQCPPPAFPYAAGEVTDSDPAAVYWAWFRRALGTRLRAAAAAGGATGAEAVLRDPTAQGICHTCEEVFGRPLSESEMVHLQQAPVSAEWLRGVLQEVSGP